MKIITHIIAGGEIYSSDKYLINKINSADCNIACDSGIRIFKKFNIIPDVFIGDFDSSSKEELKWAEKNSVKIIKFPPEKDELDLELAINYAQKINSKIIHLTGVLGNRLDQTFGNIYIMAKNNNITIDEEEIKVFSINSFMSFNAIIGETWSFLPIGQNVTGLTLEGFKYPLTNKDIDSLSPLCISNQANNNIVKINLKTGKLICIRYPGKKV